MFHSGDEVNERLLDAKPLADEEIIAALPWLNWLRETPRQRLQIESTRLNTMAIQEFNQGSTRLTKWMMALVGADRNCCTAGSPHCIPKIKDFVTWATASWRVRAAR